VVHAARSGCATHAILRRHRRFLFARATGRLHSLLSCNDSLKTDFSIVPGAGLRCSFVTTELVEPSSNHRFLSVLRVSEREPCRNAFIVLRNRARSLASELLYQMRPGGFASMAIAVLHETAIGESEVEETIRAERSDQPREVRLNADEAWLRSARLKYGSSVRVIDISAVGILIQYGGTPLTPPSDLIVELSVSIYSNHTLRAALLYAGVALWLLVVVGIWAWPWFIRPPRRRTSSRSRAAKRDEGSGWWPAAEDVARRGARQGIHGTEGARRDK